MIPHLRPRLPAKEPGQFHRGANRERIPGKCRQQLAEQYDDHGAEGDQKCALTKNRRPALAGFRISEIIGDDSRDRLGQSFMLQPLLAHQGTQGKKSNQARQNDRQPMQPGHAPHRPRNGRRLYRQNFHSALRSIHRVARLVAAQIAPRVAIEIEKIGSRCADARLLAIMTPILIAPLHSTPLR